MAAVVFRHGVVAGPDPRASLGPAWVFGRSGFSVCSPWCCAKSSVGIGCWRPSAGAPPIRCPVARGSGRRTRFDIPLIEIATHELEDANYLATHNRCFYCKTELWHRLVPLARDRGLSIVCDGTNADDLREHRPGQGAGMAPVCGRRSRRWGSPRRRSARRPASSGCRPGTRPRHPASRVGCNTDFRSPRALETG